MAEPVYYPSCVVDLVIRFDEAMLGESAPPFAEGSLSDPPVKGAKPSGVTGLVQGRGSHVYGIVPLSGTIELPSYRQAGKFNFTFAYRDLPIDPRTIRALAVEAHLGAIEASDFDRGMRMKTKNGHLASVLDATSDNEVIVGLADNVSSEHDEGKSTVTIEGRDLRGFFLDGKVKASDLAKLHLMNKDIGNVVEQILDFAPKGVKVKIEVAPAADWPDGKIPSPGTADDKTRVHLGADGDGAKAPPKGDGNSLSYWDVITQYCFLVGAIPYFRGYVLNIRPSAKLFETIKEGDGAKQKTPFSGGQPRSIQTDKGKDTIRFRRMVYGKDILRFKLERKLGGFKSPAIRVVCINTSTKDKKQYLLEARYPEKGAAGVSPDADVDAADATSVDPSGRSSQKDELIIPVSGIRNKDTLMAIARALREEIGQGEMGGSISTKNMNTLGGSGQDPDLLYLRPGEPVAFEMDAANLRTFSPIVSELGKDISMSTDELKKKLTERLGDAVLASVIVDLQRGGGKNKITSTFRVSTIRYTWGEDGIAVDFDFQNYVPARSDVTATKSTPKKNATKGTTAVLSHIESHGGGV